MLLSPFSRRLLRIPLCRLCKSPLASSLFPSLSKPPFSSAVTTVSSKRRFTTSSPRFTSPPAPLVPFRTHPPSSPTTPLAHTFFHSPTSTWTYVLVDPSTSHCAIIDSTLDFDVKSSTVSTETADALMAFVEKEGLRVERILETHAHADHLTAAKYIQRRLSSSSSTSSTTSTTSPSTTPPIGISRGILLTQQHFGPLYDVPPSSLSSAFEELYEEGDKISVGALEGEVMSLPGHTPCSAGYKFGEFVFVGDTIFLPSLGTARTDFPSGSAHSLFLSSRRLLSLPPQTRLFSGHHYPPSPAENVCSATVAEQKEWNRHVKEGVEEGVFVRMREGRDGELGEPGLLHQSLQVNIRGGALPRGENGQPYFRFPVKGPDLI